MNNLTDLEAIKKIDPRDTYGSTELLVKQCEEAWKQVNEIDVPDITGVENIVCCGMGASIYGALVTKALVGEDMQYPFETVSDYNLPKYVNDKTLVILTSYSGTTEEVLSCADQAREKNAKMIVLTKGGPLAEFAKENNIPAFIFDGALNPAGIPRLGNGYSVLGLMGLLKKTGIINIDTNALQKAIINISKKREELKNKAMRSSKMFLDKIPIIITAEHLAGNAQIFRNQFNETSKTFSAYYLVPDLNHHLMEGLQFPTNSNLHFIIIQSDNYSPKNRKRIDLTVDVLKQNRQEVFFYKTGGENVYEDFLEVMVFGSYLTLYLALLHDQNPAVNPWVDYFKKELAKK
ncbi:MAG: SIS domain-containing protein [Patescibacteria group bacterium]|nr:SIS domain-containing protein [Patescibacteria group bacterium]